MSSMASRPETRLRIAGIVDESIVDGPGLRFTVFTQGCPHHCPGCHNPQTHDFQGGRWVTVAELVRQFDEDPLLAGVTLSGGEPFCQAEALCDLAQQIRDRGKTVMAYSGYTLEQLQALPDPAVDRLLRLTDILVDGPYIQALRDLDLKFRGSSNQRLLDLREYPLVRPYET